MGYKDPAQRRKYQREWGRRKRAEASPTGNLSLPASLRSVDEVFELLERAAGAARGSLTTNPLEAARVATQIAGVALKAVETARLAARVEALEFALSGGARQ